MSAIRRAAAGVVLASLLGLTGAQAAHAAPAPPVFRVFDYPVGLSPTSVAFGDFDGAGGVDFASANGGANDLTTYVHVPGTKTFRYGGTFDVPGAGTPTDVVSADFNQDGRADLALTQFDQDPSNDAVVVMLAGPGGTFTGGKRIGVGNGPTDLVVGDFDRNGDPDLAVTNLFSDSITILLGISGGDFVREADYGVGDAPDGLAVLDADRNGDQDLVVSSWNQNQVLLFLGIDGGAFIHESDLPVGRSPHGVASGDFNGDGEADFAVGEDGEDGVSVLYGGAGPAFSGLQTFRTGRFPDKLATPDLNRDGDPDLVISDRFEGLQVAMGDPASGLFGFPFSQVTVPTDGLDVADVDANGSPDLAVVASAGSVKVLVQRATIAPTVSLTATPDRGAAGDRVQLHATAGDADGTVDKLEWDVDGDGTYDKTTTTADSVESGPLRAGTTTFYVRATDDDGNRKEASAKATASTAPVAHVTAVPAVVEPGHTTTLDASASFDSDGTIVDYRFDADGDGTFETDNGTDATLEDVGVPAGGLTIGVQVTDDFGLKASATSRVEVNRRPVAALTASPNPLEAGKPTTLDAGGSSDPDGTVVRYEFDTDGDGTFDVDTHATATAQVASVPEGSTTYAVRATDDRGTSDTATVVVKAGKRPVARLVAQPAAVLVGQGTTLNATGSTSTNGALTYAFDLDADGSYETADADGVLTIAPYSSSGTRTYRVRVSDPYGLTSTATASVAVARVATTLTARSVVGSLLGSVSATLVRSTGGQPVAGKTIVFTTPSGAALCSAPTNAAGKAQCQSPLPLVAALLTLGYRASFAGDDVYLPSADAVGLL